MFLRKIKKFFTDEKARFAFLHKMGFYNLLPDERFVKKVYCLYMGKDLDFDNPITYNEKLQWLKLYDRRPEYTAMVDKYEVKKLVADIIGEEYIIPTIGVYDKFDDIDFDSLPDSFVIKCTHDSGGLVICKDKSKLDIPAARKRINKFLKRKYYYQWREWPYKNVKPRIIVEQYMEDASTSELRDYKFFCFDGVPKLIFIASDRQKAGEETKFDFFDMDFNHLPFTNGHPNAAVPPAKPVMFEKMKELAAKLSCGIPHVRVDFYEVDGKIYFGEMTFYHWSGIVPFDPEEWDKTLGSWITLPEKREEGK